jgi:general stress protein 26
MFRSVSFSAERDVADPAHCPQVVRHVDELWRHIRALRRCSVTTRTPYGERHTRTLRLQNHALRPGEALWFLVDSAGDVGPDVAANPEVDLSFVEQDGSRVCITGQARLIGHVQRHEGAAPAAANDQPLALLEVAIEHVRYLDAADAHHLDPSAKGFQRELKFG